MNPIDIFVLFGTLVFIVVYGALKTRNNNSIQSYLKGADNTKWYTIGLSVMATQASAITFISTPGKAYEDGMGFIQNYFGMPIALIIICVVFIPIYHKLKVFTAYEYLESRFDKKTRLLGASIFLIQRGLAAGITIYAPAIILSNVLNWRLDLTIIMVGILVIIYTVSGGTRAVNLTQKWQMLIIMAGMFIAFGFIINSFPEWLTFKNAIKMAGSMDKMEIVDFDFNFKKRYTFWSGILGATFLSLSYFGTDQSQVQRYLSGSSVRESRMGLMFNAAFKIPMQFFILLTGVLVFIFYQFERPPLFFKTAELAQIEDASFQEKYALLEEEANRVHADRAIALEELNTAYNSQNQADIEEGTACIQRLNNTYQALRLEAKRSIVAADERVKPKDSDYVFLSFIMNYLPVGIIGLLLAVIFSAAMSSTAGEVNALASTTVIDYYKRLYKPKASDRHYLMISKAFTLLWGLLAITFALFASLVENLIEAVNILGSIFYGTVLGIFLVAFFLKWVKSNAVFMAAIIAQILVILLHYLSETGQIELSYLWYNAIGCLAVVVLSALFERFLPKGLVFNE